MPGREETAFGLKLSDKGLKVVAGLITAALLGGGSLTVGNIIGGLKDEGAVVREGADEAIWHIRALENEIGGLKSEIRFIDSEFRDCQDELASGGAVLTPG